MNMLKKVIFLLTILAASVAMAAEPVNSVETNIDTAQDGSSKYIGNLVFENRDDGYLIFVEKEPKLLYLVKVQDNVPVVEKSITVLTGRNDGNKFVRGDEKTPEGVYYVNGFFSKEYMDGAFGDLAYRYGTGAYPITYPNVVDKINGKTGSGIWIHGMDPERGKPVTEGCVAMKNEELDALADIMHDDMPVVIVENADFYTEDEYSAVKAESLNNLHDFIKAWSYGPFDNFKSYIHPDYSSYSASNAKSYLASKEYLMKAFPDKEIVSDNVSIYRQGDELLVYDFDQFYCAPNIISYGNKRIYMAPDSADNGKFKVISEEMFSNSPYNYLDPQVRLFIENWATAWESKDINDYMSFYSEEFKGRAAYQADKAKLFASTNSIDVKITDIKWEIVSGNLIKATFKQEYQSDTLSDVGRKTIYIKGCPSAFGIQSEDWSRL